MNYKNIYNFKEKAQLSKTKKARGLTIEENLRKLKMTIDKQSSECYNKENGTRKEMKTMLYYINAYLKNGTEITVKTNDIDIALREFFRYTNQGEHTDLVDGFTGEVYIISNTDEPYITEQWALTVLGWLVNENLI